MFDFVRKHNKIMQWLLFLLIFPSFVLFGLEGYNRYRERGETVAKVDGQDITKQEWDNAHKQQVDRVRQQMPNIDPKLLDSDEARYGTLERIVQDRVLAAAVEHEHLSVGDARLAHELQRNELVQAMRKPDGTFDVERYKQLLAGQGMTPQMYENQVRGEVATRQVMAGVTDTGYVPPAQAAPAINAFFEKREVQIARFAPADYQAKVQPSDADLQAYYKANEKLFQAPEQASVEWVMLDLPTVAKGITINEQDLQDYYKNNQANLARKEERRASHILIEVPKGASPEVKAKAKAKAEELLAQVKKNPDSFAEVAKKNSQDAGSAPNGGDLDYFARGAMTKPFEDAAFALKKGEISNVVETEFGYHIIKLTDIKGGASRSFEEMKPELEAEVKKQQAQKKFAESAETFSNTVYEQSDSLKPVADKLKLEVHTAANVMRDPAQAAAGPLANPKFLQALFAPDAIERKRNTEAVEIGPNQLVSGRVSQYTPAHTRPFEEVKDQVRTRLVAERAAELARKDGEEKLAAWKSNPASANLPAATTISRQDAGKDKPKKLIEAALRADPGALPAWAGVDLGADGYAVVKVNKLLPREAPPAPQARQELAQYTGAWTAAEALAYYETLKARYKVQINVPKPKELLPGLK